MLFSLSLTPVQWTLAGALLLATGIQLCYWLFYFRLPARRAGRQSNPDEKEARPPVSVVLYTQNEATDLAENLPLLLEQTYPEFEVIVVNDGSTDDSKDVVSHLQYSYPNLYQTFVPDGAKSLSRKKLALTMGIKAARHDVILLTLANCRPCSNRWIERMARRFDPETEVILGIGFTPPGKGIAGRYRAWDRLLHTLHCISFALLGKPYRGFAVNLAYRKSLFFRNKGFSHHLDLHYGDDDLFINEVANGRNCRVELSRESLVEERFDRPGAAWQEEKLRYDFTAHFLKTSAKRVFAGETASRWLFWGCIFAFPLSGGANLLPGALALACFGIRFTVQQFVLYGCRKQFYPTRIGLLLPLFELGQPFVDGYLHLVGASSRKKNYIWKKR